MLCRNFTKPCPAAAGLRVLESTSLEARCPSCGSPLIQVPASPKPWPGLGRFLFWLGLVFTVTFVLVGTLLWFLNPAQLRERRKLQSDTRILTAESTPDLFRSQSG